MEMVTKEDRKRKSNRKAEFKESAEQGTKACPQRHTSKSKLKYLMTAPEKVGSFRRECECSLLGSEGCPVDLLSS